MIGGVVRVPPPMRGRFLAASAALLGLAFLRCGGEEPATPAGRGGEGDSHGTMRSSGVARPAAQDRVPADVRLPPPAFRWTDATPASGIGSTNHSGQAGVKEYLVEAVGVGPAWLDFDGDGDLDLYEPEGDVLSNYTLEKAPDPS